MTYRRSSYRNAFDMQATDLLQRARQARRLGKTYPKLRDSVFQCSILLVVAALETYIRLLVESWIQNKRKNDLGHTAPMDARAFIASKTLERTFALFQYNRDEKALYTALKSKSDLWPFLCGDSKLPPFFDGKVLHDGATYPSSKNMRKLFGRLGINDMIDRLSRDLSRDVEVLIDGFQGIRTALAHSSPPPLTIADVERHLADCKSLVAAVDRILYVHVMRHGGPDCWTV
jgi:RiboL-PSP-HEPN